MSLRRHLCSGAAGVAVLALVLAACTPGSPDPTSDQPNELPGWQTVTLPGGMRPSTVQVDGDELLVGGSTGDDAARSPALVRRSTAEPASVWRTVPLTPATPYGERAALVSVTGDGGSIVALGMAHGGAHANFRWTIWTGTSAGVVDRPQTFETFGGQEAGGLLAVAHDDRGPLIVGTWQGAHGLDGAIWRTQSERWVRQPTPASLVSTVDRQTAPRTAATQADGSVAISGSVIDLADGVRQSAAVWRGSGVDWRLSLPADPGKRSEAWSTVCEGSGPPGCWSVGSREGAVAVWSDDGRSSLPELRVGDDDAGVIARHGDRVVAAISTHGQGRLLVGHDGAWRLYTGPDGVVRAAALVGSRLYLISEREDSAVLSTRDLGDLLVG